MRQLLYYEMRQKFIIKGFRFFITKCDSFITKYCAYFKMQSLLQNESVHGLIVNFPLINVMVNILLRKISGGNLNEAIFLAKTNITLKVMSISANEVTSSTFPQKIFLKPFQDEGWQKGPPYQFYPCNFYKCRN